jgi:murein L,D-transpeptidase YcbB/YkuD
VREALIARLPTNPQYQALKNMLAKTPVSDATTIGQLRVSMERWRWMPRDFGPGYIFVNVPAFNVALVQDGRALARHRVIVGKPKNPTPQLFVKATGVIINPTWTVPQSIIRESVGKMVTRHPQKARAQGYVTTIVNGQMQVVQGPGPSNALGAMKLFMPNPYSIYLHDTPSKSLFENKVRAFSHGCIRTDQALRFASVMLRDVPGWSRAKIDQTVASRKTTKVDLPQPFNVLITYLTAVAEDNGKLKTYRDIYGRDVPVLEALDK